MNNRQGSLSRHDATRRVMKSLARPEFAHLPSYESPDHTVPIVVALPSENVSEVMARVSHIGGRANVAVAFADRFSMFVMGTSSSSEDFLEINQDLSMGMFLIRVQKNPGKKIRFRFRDVNSEIPSVVADLAYA